ncbi:FecR domain-containing protein [Paralcaligenes sp. KSB-10]|uniref:FecR domain-containing protein n=1 Tax=Paralcaligenes sp. KSB-10 TaxID=2901142 RepID=UPI001E30E533|nr:FecR domain-containing protein [Paralcaligenes sp. KSB-10]UHL63576.1 FecR domain-containing protein [Paralcaligenes sp. KSB-10]
MSGRHLFLSLFITGMLGSASTAAFAQASGARGDDFLYRVMPNDTLIALASRFTTGPGNWNTLQSINAVQDPAKLPIGLELKIPFAMIPELPASATVTHVSGQASADGQNLRAQDRIAEGKTIATGSDGFVTLLLSDGSVLSIPSSSTLALERMRAFKGTGLIDSITRMKQGSLESSVAPKGTGVGRFEVRTPVSITGVRGTRLRVHASTRGAQSEVVKGTAQITSQQSQNATLHQDQGTAIDPQGKLLGVRTLLPAAALSAPKRAGGGSWSLSFPPVPGASEYLVRVSSDKDGADLVSSRRFAAPDVKFSAPGPGTYYVAVRAIDALGIGGNDARQAFLGTSVLNSSNGTPVLSGSGTYILLTDY